MLGKLFAVYCTEFGGTGYRIEGFQWLGMCHIVFDLMDTSPPT